MSTSHDQMLEPTSPANPPAAPTDTCRSALARSMRAIISVLSDEELAEVVNEVDLEKFRRANSSDYSEVPEQRPTTPRYIAEHILSLRPTLPPLRPYLRYGNTVDYGDNLDFGEAPNFGDTLLAPMMPTVLTSGIGHPANQAYRTRNDLRVMTAVDVPPANEAYQTPGRTMPEPESRAGFLQEIDLYRVTPHGENWQIPDIPSEFYGVAAPDHGDAGVFQGLEAGHVAAGRLVSPDAATGLGVSYQAADDSQAADISQGAGHVRRLAWSPEELRARYGSPPALGLPQQIVSDVRNDAQGQCEYGGFSTKGQKRKRVLGESE